MPEIPESVARRIQAMLARTVENGCTEAEATVAAGKVQELLGAYNLELAQFLVSDDTVDPDAEREKVDGAEIAADWQVNLMASIARGQFCLAFTQYEGEVRRHGLVGRRINVAATMRVYEYLVSTMERLNPFTDGRKKKARLSWFDGCSERLCERLAVQRAESEAASRASRGDVPRGNGADLVLADVYSSESDLNNDMRYDLEPGTTARRRAESLARYEAERAEREARWAREEAARKPETPRERREREARERLLRRQWKAEERKAAAKRDADAYAMGANAGRHIGLDAQVGSEKRAALV